MLKQVNYSSPGLARLEARCEEDVSVIKMNKWESLLWILHFLCQPIYFSLMGDGAYFS